MRQPSERSRQELRREKATWLQAKCRQRRGGNAWREEGEHDNKGEARSGEATGMHGMVARISSRNRMPGAEIQSLNRRNRIGISRKTSVCTIPVQRGVPSVLVPQQTGHVEQPYDTRTIHLSRTEKGLVIGRGVCQLESGTSKPHGMSTAHKTLAPAV